MLSLNTRHMSSEELVEVVASGLPQGDLAYVELLTAIKHRVAQAQSRVVSAANQALIEMNWEIGKELLARQDAVKNWGGKGEIIAQLATDLAQEFPGMQGLSRANLYRMRRFASEWPDDGLVAAVRRQISWTHHKMLLEKLDTQEDRLWYAEQTLAHGWSSRILVHQIESGLKERTGNAATNFSLALPDEDSELAQELVKSEYNLEFLRFTAGFQEKDLEEGLIGAISKVLLELGGLSWSFVGRQVHLMIGGDDFFIDLLFFHRRLNRLIVVDLKIDEFKPEYAGKMAFYQQAVDAKLREEHENESIGIVLCQGSNQTVAEYTLRGLSQPMGIARYSVGQELPPEIRNELPSISAIQSRVQKALEMGASPSLGDGGS